MWVKAEEKDDNDEDEVKEEEEPGKKTDLRYIANPED